MSELLKGIELLRVGQVEAAHEIAQHDGSQYGAWLHGIVHIVDGRESNARYWYDRISRPFPGMHAADAEIQRLSAALTRTSV